MATITTTPRWIAASLPAIAVEPALPPRETWPLLVTIVVTWLMMLAVIAWYATGAG